TGIIGCANRITSGADPSVKPCGLLSLIRSGIRSGTTDGVFSTTGGKCSLMTCTFVGQGGDSGGKGPCLLRVFALVVTSVCGGINPSKAVILSCGNLSIPACCSVAGHGDRPFWAVLLTARLVVVVSPADSCKLKSKSIGFLPEVANSFRVGARAN